MNRTNLFAVAALALGVFACERSADRASETKTTSASQPVDTSGTTAPAPAAPADTSMNVTADAKDGGHESNTPSGKRNLDMNAKDGGHRSMTTGRPTGTADGPNHANTGGSHDIGAGGSPTH
ncbi:MAG: hypothetical protein QOI41_1883 [Myxococcales bacterium]|nr:hypothetical protein [Myxococcales bacterium]